MVFFRILDFKEFGIESYGIHRIMWNPMNSIEPAHMWAVCAPDPKICYYTYIARGSAKYCISSTEKHIKYTGKLWYFLEFCISRSLA